MFVAHDKITTERVTSIDSGWNERVDELRQRARDGSLVCPGCEQMLWLRTGELRRRHFAHRQAAECPLDKESPEVMEVKAQLYEWLMSKYPGKVALDVDLAIPGWKKPADLVVTVDSGLQLIYCVFDRQQRHREALLKWSHARNVHFIHTESTHDRENQSKTLKLTASQRDCICRTGYDEPAKWAGGHLYFVEGPTSRLTIYRGLMCIHEPNVYSWRNERTGPLKTALIAPKTGEIVFAADVEARQALKAEQAREAREREERRKEAKRLERERQERWRTVSKPPTDMVAEVSPLPSTQTVAPSPEPVPLPTTMNQGPFRCESCGTETMDWNSASPAEGTCICKACTKRKWEEARNQPRPEPVPPKARAWLRTQRRPR